jgi:steroid delta-isomerase-like uncharacterized protein
MLTDEMKAIPRRITDDAWNRGNLDVLAAFVAPDFVRHTPRRPDSIRGVEGFKQHVTTTRAAFPDAEFLIEDEVAEGDWIVNRWTFRGTHRADFGGIPATSAFVTMTGISFVRVADGEVAEIWDEVDALGLLRQLGVMPAPSDRAE